MAQREGRVVVIGASMAGLVAARALADVAGEVVILDRDELPDAPETRKGVPQGRHAHALLRAGELILDQLFPLLGDELVAQGALRRWWLADAMCWQFDGYRSRQGTFDYEVIFLTRPLLENTVRRRVAGLSNVQIRSGVRVRGLTVRDGTVSGVAVDGGTTSATLEAAVG